MIINLANLAYKINKKGHLVIHIVSLLKYISQKNPKVFETAHSNLFLLTASANKQLVSLLYYTRTHPPSHIKVDTDFTVYSPYGKGGYAKCIVSN